MKKKMIYLCNKLKFVIKLKNTISIKLVQYILVEIYACTNVQNIFEFQYKTLFFR